VTTINQEWETFYAACRGPDIDPVRVRELKACFFAGAFAAHRLTLLACLPTLPPNEIKRNLNAINSEALDYLASLAKETPQ
jgi:hypothetical protein